MAEHDNHHPAHTDRAPLGFTQQEKSAWSVGVEYGMSLAASAQDVAPTDAREALRREQGLAVMPLIGPLLDAWDGASHDDRTEMIRCGVGQHIRAIYRAMTEDRTAQPAAQPAGYTDGWRNMFFDGLFDGETERERTARLQWANDMRAAFERHTGNGWFDKSWRQETGIWAAAWRAATAAQPADAQDTARLDWLIECGDMVHVGGGVNALQICVTLTGAGEIDLGDERANSRAHIDSARTQGGAAAPAATQEVQEAQPVVRIYVEGDMRTSVWLDGASALPDGEHALYAAAQPAALYDAGAENTAFQAWWNARQAHPAHSLITENAAHATWQERAKRAATHPHPSGDSGQVAGGQQNEGGQQ